MRAFFWLGRSVLFLFLPNLAMASWFLAAWIDPASAGPTIVKAAFAAMLLEFVMMHSAIFFASAAGKPGVFIGFAAFYSIFAVGAAFVVKALWPLAVFLVHAVSTFSGNASDAIEFGTRGGEKIRLSPRWFVMFGVYVAVFPLAAILPFPTLGFTPEAFAALDTAGITVNDQPLTPETARDMVAAVFLYYLLVGTFEIAWGAVRRLRPAPRPEEAKGLADLAGVIASGPEPVLPLAAAVLLAILGSVAAVGGGTAVTLAFLREDRSAEWASLEAEAEARGGEAVSYPAPPFDLPDLEGRSIRFPDDAAGRPAVLSIWLERCPDCLPSFGPGRRLADEFRPRGVRFYHVAARFVRDPTRTAAFAREVGLDDPVLLDSGLQVPALYGVSTYTVFVVDGAGVVRYRGGVGGAREAIGRLLGGAASSSIETTPATFRTHP